MNNIEHRCFWETLKTSIKVSKAIAKENLKKEGFYDYEKGTEFKVLNTTPALIHVEDFLGFQYWMKSELFDIN